jgi:hypothetical protein
MARQLISGAGGLLNHVEMVYRPSERALVRRLFEALGCKVIETGGRFLVIHADPQAADPRMLDNCLYASEVTPEQWRFEEALQRELGSRRELLESYQAFAAMTRRTPQHTTHFGIRLSSLARLEEILTSLESLRDEEPLWRRRVEISGVFRPGDAESLSDTLVQAFVRTDVCAAGFISLGQHIELQAVTDTEEER